MLVSTVFATDLCDQYWYGKVLVQHWDDLVVHWRIDEGQGPNGLAGPIGLGPNGQGQIDPGLNCPAAAALFLQLVVCAQYSLIL